MESSASFLEGEVGVQVDLGGLGPLVAEPERDHGDVDVNTAGAAGRRSRDADAR